MNDFVTPRPATRKPSPMDAIVRLLAISMRRYTTEPDGRAAAARNLLFNAVRLARAEMGGTATAELLDQAMAEPNWTERR